MATETILIEISADATKMQPVIDQLVKMGQVSAKDAEEFKKLSAETAKLADATVRTTEAIKQGAAETTKASTTKEAALAKEITALKQLQELSKKAADPASAQKFAAAIKESETRIKSLNTELGKTSKPVKDADSSFKSLRTQLLEARNEAIRLAEKFGELSPQALAAAKSAAVIDDRVKDLNRTLQALNPEQKLGAFLQVGVGISGAFTAAQGAMALFGNESEDVQKALLKVQAALALTQGLQSVLGLKDAFKDLRLVLGLTTVAQTGLTTATTAGAAATTTANVATKGFIATLFGSPLAPIILGLGALAGIFLLISDNTKEATESQKEFSEEIDTTTEALENLNRLGQLSANQVIAKLSSGMDVASFSTAELKAALSDLQEQLERLSERTAATFDVSGTDNVLETQKKGIADLITQIEKVINKRAEEVKSVQRLKEEIKELQDIDIDFSKFDRDTRAIVKLLDEFATATQSGKNAVNDFNLKIQELVENLEKIPDKLDDAGRSVKNIPIEFDKAGDGIRKAFASIFGEDSFLTDEGLDALRDFAELGKDIFIDVFSTFASGVQGNIDELNRQKDEQLSAYDQQLEGLEELNQNKIISDGVYAQKVKEINKQREQSEKELNKKISEEKRKAFIADRIATLSRISIQTAENAVKLFAATIPPGILSALAIAFGALQAGFVLSAPVPKFKSGVLGLKGKGSETSDSIPAMLSKGESVMTAKETKLFMPTLSAIRKNLIPASVLNSFVVEGKGGRVEAYLDANKLSRVNRKDMPRQADLIGRSVAKHLNKNTVYSPIRGEWIN